MVNDQPKWPTVIISNRPCHKIEWQIVLKNTYKPIKTLLMLEKVFFCTLKPRKTRKAWAPKNSVIDITLLLLWSWWRCFMVKAYCLWKLCLCWNSYMYCFVATWHLFYPCMKSHSSNPFMHSNWSKWHLHVKRVIPLIHMCPVALEISGGKTHCSLQYKQLMGIQDLKCNLRVEFKVL